MLTDIFLNRYADVPLWSTFEERDRRFLVQAFRIIEERAYPYFILGEISSDAKQKWKIIHDLLSTELGLKELSQRYYSYDKNFNGRLTTINGFFEWNYVCQKFVLATYHEPIPANGFMKERISFFEIALREFYRDVQESNRELPKKVADWKTKNTIQPFRSNRTLRIPNQQDRSISSPVEVENRLLNERYTSIVEEFNARIRQAGYPLHYHNGFIQISEDELLISEIEQPFWNVVSDSTWKNVDVDMKEAVDCRDTGRRDPAFYAARALESTVKIISDQKGWTHGREKSVHNYLDNLGSTKAGSLIESWEKQNLKEFFTNIRNPIAHGPGSAEMPELTPAQTDWAIETCMVWIKALIKRM